jgi:hypothetical protein
MTQPEQSALAYHLGHRILVHSQSRTPEGLWIATAPFIRLEGTPDPEELGRAVLGALDASVMDHPTPADPKEVTAALVKGAGVRSYAALQRAAALCGITRNTGGCRIVPHHNGGTSGDGRGFHELPEVGEELKADVPAAELGVVVVAAFGRCSSIYDDGEG